VSGWDSGAETFNGDIIDGSKLAVVFAVFGLLESDDGSLESGWADFFVDFEDVLSATVFELILASQSVVTLEYQSQR